MLPIHQNVRELILHDRQDPERKLVVPRKINVGIPSITKTDVLDKVPKIHVRSIGRRPFHLKTWHNKILWTGEATSALLEPNPTATSVFGSLYSWLNKFERCLEWKTSREKIRSTTPVLTIVTGFLADAAAESVHMAAGSTVLPNSASRALWLKPWQGMI